ncbi:DNA-directed RNA polymerase subunit omega [uncultured Campylobacter sp.]|uniref:DNA-directed RNA polymerase subunit omega n=1 Tax=uncultured Campylobacter sp. TaxID=218934 RepID=UPI0026259ABE|nr:DNA-directed RNA polymerase subunit omega [uncultured Campylobacter sp.]
MERRIENIVAQALKRVDGDRYKLALMVAKRVETLSNGEPNLVEGIDTKKMKFSDIALLEIAQGKVLLDGIVEANQ